MNNKQILIVSFHQVVFAGVFFNGFRIGFQQVKLPLGVFNERVKMRFAFLKVGQFILPCHNQRPILYIKKPHPYSKQYNRNKVFVFYERKDKP